jgi:thioredoxin reductase (NADPH)
MRQPNVTIYGSRQCRDTERVTRHLDSARVPYEFKDVDESPEYNDFVAGLNNGKRIIPAVRINNETYINPDIAKLDEVLAAETPTERGEV